MNRTLLWDLDGTILDFEAAERCAIQACFQEFALPAITDEQIRTYSALNARYWERLEAGELTKPQILVGRFEEFFGQLGIDPTIAKDFNASYQIRLGDTIVFHDSAYELLTDLKAKGIRQVLITNGTKTAQEKKLKNSNLNAIFDAIYISENTGYEKPQPEYFEVVLNGIGNPDRQECLIIGDSLTSDMQGGVNANIPVCWYNPKHLVNTKGLPIDYEITNLQEVRTRNLFNLESKTSR